MTKAGEFLKSILGGHEWITKEFNENAKTRPACGF